MCVGQRDDNQFLGGVGHDLAAAGTVVAKGVEGQQLREQRRCAGGLQCPTDAPGLARIGPDAADNRVCTGHTRSLIVRHRPHRRIAQHARAVGHEVHGKARHVAGAGHHTECWVGETMTIVRVVHVARRPLGQRAAHIGNGTGSADGEVCFGQAHRLQNQLVHQGDKRFAGAQQCHLGQNQPVVVAVAQLGAGGKQRLRFERLVEHIGQRRVITQALGHHG